jgi:hypothetical protein
MTLTWFTDSDVQETRKLLGCGLCRVTTAGVEPILRFSDVTSGDELEMLFPEVPTEDMRLRQLEAYVANRDSDLEGVVSYFFK